MSKISDLSSIYEETEVSVRSGDLLLFLKEGIGNRIGYAASRLGSRGNAYEAMGISSATLQRYISGETAPTFEAIARLCIRAGVRMEWLATGAGQKLITDVTPVTVPRGVEDSSRLTPPGGVSMDAGLLGKAVRVVDDVLRRHGIRDDASPEQFAELVRIAYEDMARGMAEDKALSALDRIIRIAKP